MKKLAILSPLVLLATTALAQDSTCILQPSCSQLGYTSAEADCGSAKVLRCPFDVSQVACLSGGSDSSGGSGGEPSDEYGTVDNSACQVGYIYYSDDTCSPEYNYFKDPIGIVFDANRRYIIGLTEKTGVKWSTITTPPDGLPQIHYSDKVALRRDLNGKNYTNILLEDAESYPAAKYCGDLTDGGKEWFLPSTGQFYLLEPLITTINSAISKITSHSAATFMTRCNNPYWSLNLYIGSGYYDVTVFRNKATSGFYTTTASPSYHSYTSSNCSECNNSSYSFVARCIAEY